jgi:hypothetical protein
MIADRLSTSTFELGDLLGQHYMAEVNLSQLEPSLFITTSITYPAYVTALSYLSLSKHFIFDASSFSKAFHPAPPAFAGTLDSVPRTSGI